MRVKKEAKKITAFIMALVLIATAVSINTSLIVRADQLLSPVSGVPIQSEVEDLEPLSEPQSTLSFSDINEINIAEQKLQADQLVASKSSFSALKQDDKQLLLSAYHLKEEYISDCEARGYSLPDSVQMTSIALMMRESLDFAEDMTSAYDSIADAYREAEAFFDLTYDYPSLSEEQIEKLNKLVSLGYETRRAALALVAAEAMGLDVFEIIAMRDVEVDADLSFLDENITITSDIDGFEEYADEETGAKPPFFEEEITNADTDGQDKYAGEASTVASTAKAYGVKASVLLDYMEENQISATELCVMLYNKQIMMDIFLPEISINAASDDNTANIRAGYPAATFDYRNAGKDTVNLNTGALIYEDYLASIPGVNGNDLELTLQYDSSLATTDQIRGVMEFDSRKNYKFNVHVTFEWYYYMLGDSEIERIDPGWFPGEDFGKKFSKTNLSYTDAMNFANTLMINGSQQDSGAVAQILNNSSLNTMLNKIRNGLNSSLGPCLVLLTPCVKLQLVPGSNIPNCINVVEENNYGRPTFGWIGDGWRLALDCIIFDGNDAYLRLAGGNVHPLGYTYYDYGLKNYKLKDMKLTKVSYDKLCEGAAYKLEFADGRIEFFDSDGTIIAMFDKYENSVIFDWNFGLNSKIIGSDGQITRIEYPMGTNSYTDVKFTFPDQSTIKLEYKTLMSTDDHWHRVLNKKTDQMGRVTTYEYKLAEAPFDFFLSYGGSSGGPAYYANLEKVNYPTGASTSFTYEKAFKDHISSNYDTVALCYYRVESRQENISDKVYNKETYKYDRSLIVNPGDIKVYYEKTIVTNLNNVETTYEYNEKNQKESEITKINNSVIKGVKYTYSANDSAPPLPIEIRTTKFGSSGITTIELFNYDSYGNVTEYWSPLANGDRKNNEYKTSFIYDSKSNMLTEKTYKRDANATIKEKYELTPDKKSVAGALVYENGSSIPVSRTDYEYNSKGCVTRTKEYYSGSNFVQTDITYTTGGARPASVTAGGVSQSFTYDAMGRTLTAKDGNGNITKFSYDALGRVTKTTNPDNSFTTNAYNDSLNTLTVTNETGTAMKYCYDKLGNITSVVDAAANTVLNSFEYDNIMRIVKSKDSKSNATDYTYDYKNRILTMSQGNLYKETYVYNDAVDSNTSSVTKTIEGDTNAPSVKTAAYTDKYGRLVRESVFNGSTEYINDYGYDYAGNRITELSAKDKADGRTYTAKYDYDYAGRVTKLTQADGNVYSTVYDGLGRKVNATDPKGGVFKYAYDNLSRLVREELPFDGAYISVKTYEYDKNGNMTRQLVSNSLPGASVTYAETKYEYNKRNFLTKVTSAPGKSESSYVTYEYDSAGNMTSMATGNGAQTTRYEYDRLSRLTKLTDPLGQIETCGYDTNNNMITKKDRNGNTFTYTYDAMNRPLTVNSKLPNGSAAAEFMSYTYTKTGAVLTEKNETLTTTNTYDALGRLIKQTETGGIEKTYTYDLANNRKTFTLKQNGTARTSASYDYDVMNRLYKVYDSGALSATYTYDKNGNRATLTYPNGNVTTYTYNAANLVTRVVNKSGATTLSDFAYSYYLDGNQYEKTEGKTQEKTQYTYDGLGRLTKERLTDPQGSQEKCYCYDSANNRVSMSVEGTGAYKTFVSVVITSYKYDKNNRLTESTCDTITEYTYDRNGNQTSKTEKERIYVAPPQPTSSGVAIYGGTGQNNQMDSDPILITPTPNPIWVTQSPPSNPIWVTPIPSSKPEPEPEYVIISKETYTYDTFNRLTKAIDAATTAIYTYKADGLRHTKTVNNVKTTHVWDGSNIALELNSSNAVSARYIRGVNLIKTDKNVYFLYNAHGDVVQLTSNLGVVKKNYRYDAFGVEIGKADNDTNPWRYCGEYWDEETGTVYLRARRYSPRTGRMLSEDFYRARRMNIYDPYSNYQGVSLNGGVYKDSGKGQYIVDDPLSLNLYTYAGNNPVRFQDSSGMFLGTIMGGLIGGIIGGVFAAAQGKDFWTGVVSGATSGAIVGAAADILIVPGAGAVAILGVSFAGGVAGYTGNLIDQIGNQWQWGKGVNLLTAFGNVDQVSAMRSAAIGMISGALSGTASLFLTNAHQTSIDLFNFMLDNGAFDIVFDSAGNALIRSAATSFILDSMTGAIYTVLEYGIEYFTSIDIGYYDGGSGYGGKHRRSAY